MNLEDLSRIEKKTYDLIKRKGEIQTRNLPDKRMIGAIANLKNTGLVEIYTRYTSRYRRKKKKFVRIKDIHMDQSLVKKGGDLSCQKKIGGQDGLEREDGPSLEVSET